MKTISFPQMPEAKIKGQMPLNFVMLPPHWNFGPPGAVGVAFGQLLAVVIAACAEQGFVQRVIDAKRRAEGGVVE